MSAVTPDDLISPEYREQLELLRSEKFKPRWGNGGARHVDNILRLVGAGESVLDYGCGLGFILAALAERAPRLRLAGYDPGIPERAALPEPADFLISTDCLEHIEPELLDNVLRHMRSLTKRAAYINVHTQAANTKLPDGRNAHLTQKPLDWWQAKLGEHYTTVQYLGGGAIRPNFLCE